MILSMTGFGKAVTEFGEKKITVEVKSLNSKQLDLNIRIPSVYREKEMEMRTYLLQSLERGKVDVSIFIESIGKSTTSQINQSALESYYQQIVDASSLLQINLPSDWFSILLKLPEVIKTEISDLDEEEWQAVWNTLDAATKNLLLFRTQEGSMLQSLFEEKIANIAQLLLEIEKFEEGRIDKIREKIKDAIDKQEISSFDTNRFEQELIYYIEKLDVNEEKSRLNNHLQYFLQTMKEGKGQGKKLGFIVQEIGREVNTLGSKSNQADMQQVVVRMKDELEQIKEQILNVL